MSWNLTPTPPQWYMAFWVVMSVILFVVIVAAIVTAHLIIKRYG